MFNVDSHSLDLQLYLCLEDTNPQKGCVSSEPWPDVSHFLQKCHHLQWVEHWRTSSSMKEDKTEWSSTGAQPCCSSEVMQCSMSAVHVSQADIEENGTGYTGRSALVVNYLRSTASADDHFWTMQLCHSFKCHLALHLLSTSISNLLSLSHSPPFLIETEQLMWQNLHTFFLFCLWVSYQYLTWRQTQSHVTICTCRIPVLFSFLQKHILKTWERECLETPCTCSSAPKDIHPRQVVISW